MTDSSCERGAPTRSLALALAVASLAACTGEVSETAWGVAPPSPVEPAGDGATPPVHGDAGIAWGADAGPASSSDDAGVVAPPGTEPGVDAGLASPEEGVAMFVAAGKFGRVTTSCDDGRTWAFNRSDDDGASCAGIDCDHHRGSATGLAFGNGDVYASFGWGDHPARILRSGDGRWSTAYDSAGFSFAGIAWAGDRLVAGDTIPRYSLDRGVTWTAAAMPAYEVPGGAWPVARAIGYSPAAGGQVAMLVAEGNGAWADTVVSGDRGRTYPHPRSVPAECTGYRPTLTVGGGVWLQVWGMTGIVCRSTDGGDTWTATRAVTSPTDRTTAAVWTGTEFVFYQGRRGYRSADGARWEAFDVDVEIGVVAHDPATHMFVAVSGEYDGQRFYRSTDGIRFSELPAAAATRSHPITHIAFGRASMCR